jgi:hypothetical protein
MENDNQNLVEALAKVSGEIPSIGKDGTNKFQSYYYVQKDDIFAAVRPILAKHKIVFVPSLVSFDIAEKVIIANFDMAFYGYGSVIRANWSASALFESKAGAFDDKAITKAASSAVKYFLISTFLIDTGERDHDGYNGISEATLPPKKTKNFKGQPPLPFWKDEVKVKEFVEMAGAFVPEGAHAILSTLNVWAKTEARRFSELDGLIESYQALAMLAVADAVTKIKPVEDSLDLLEDTAAWNNRSDEFKEAVKNFAAIKHKEHNS